MSPRLSLQLRRPQIQRFALHMPVMTTYNQAIERVTPRSCFMSLSLFTYARTRTHPPPPTHTNTHAHTHTHTHTHARTHACTHAHTHTHDTTHKHARTHNWWCNTCCQILPFSFLKICLFINPSSFLQAFDPA